MEGQAGRERERQRERVHDTLHGKLNLGLVSISLFVLLFPLISRILSVPRDEESKLSTRAPDGVIK